MDPVRALIAFLRGWGLVAALLFVGCFYLLPAQAQFPAERLTSWGSNPGQLFFDYGECIGGVHDCGPAAIGAYNGASGTSYTYAGNQSGCSMARFFGLWTVYGQVLPDPPTPVLCVAENRVCPPGSFKDTASPPQCHCEAGLVETGVPFAMWENACTPSDGCPIAGGPNPYAGTMISGSGSTPSTLCYLGCEFDYSSAVGMPLANSWSAWVGQGLGQQCSAGTGQDDPAGCPTAQCPGEVNGSTVCVPCSATPGTTTTTKGEATTTTTNNDSTGAPTGSSTTQQESTTTTSGGQSTTTTTTTTTNFDASGNPTGSSTTVTTDTGGDDFCKKHPTSSICMNSTFSGSCESSFACQGDAAQCAAARAINELNCQFQPDGSTVADVLASSGLDTAEDDWKTAQQGNAFDLSNLLEFDTRSVSPANCPGPYTFTLPASMGGQEIGISMEFMCDIAGVVGIFLLLGATVLSVRIVAEGF